MAALDQNQSPTSKPEPTSAMEPQDLDDANIAVGTERGMSVRDSLRLWPKAIVFSFFISLAIIMEVHSPLTLFQHKWKQLLI